MNRPTVKCIFTGEVILRNGKVLPNYTELWIESKETKTRVPCCSSYEPNQSDLESDEFHKYIATFIRGPRHKWSFGNRMTRLDLARLKNDGKCYDCEKVIARGEETSKGLLLYHKKCLGIFENLRPNV